MGELLIAVAVMCVTFGVLGGWAFRADRDRRRALGAPPQKKEVV
jgi:hypothetical protein